MRIALVLFGLALVVFTAIIYQNTQALSREVDALKTLKGEATEVREELYEEEEFEVAVYMNRLQLYSAKLYFAGEAGNDELAHFYLHELEEVIEEVVEAKISDEGIPVSANMKTYGEPAIKMLEQALENEQGISFESAYENLVTSCNSCHIATKHEFIRIRKPQSLPLDNQDFERDPS